MCRPDTLWGVFERIDHIGVAVEDLDAALALYGDALEMPVAHREAVRARRRDALQLLGLAAEDLDLRAGLAHGLHERLRVEPAPRLRIGREGDAHSA